MRADGRGRSSADRLDPRTAFFAACLASGQVLLVLFHAPVFLAVWYLPVISYLPIRFVFRTSGVTHLADTP